MHPPPPHSESGLQDSLFDISWLVSGSQNLGHGVLGSGMATQATTAHLESGENNVASLMCSACCVMCCILVIIRVVRLLYIYFGFYSKYVLSASTESCKHRWKSSDLATHWGGQTIHGAYLAHALRFVVAYHLRCTSLLSWLLLLDKLYYVFLDAEL